MSKENKKEIKDKLQIIEGTLLNIKTQSEMYKSTPKKFRDYCFNSYLLVKQLSKDIKELILK